MAENCVQHSSPNFLFNLISTSGEKKCVCIYIYKIYIYYQLWSPEKNLQINIFFLFHECCILKLRLLLNQSNLLKLGCGEGILLPGHLFVRRTGSLCSKDLNSSVAFREEFLKAIYRIRIARCLTSLLVGDKVNWCFGSCNHQSSGSSQSGVCKLWSACCHSHLPGLGRESLRFCRTTWIYASNCYVYPLRRN